MNRATQQRDSVAAIAASRPEEALELARRIDDPWFRCQALSIAAVRARDVGAREQAIDDAFASANTLADPNRIVTVSSWPLKALALTGNLPRVSSEVSRLLQIISLERSPVRRADALRYVLGSVSIAAKDVAGLVAKEFAAACLEPLLNGKRNKKGESHLEECLPAIAQIEPELANELLDKLAPSRAERVIRAIQASKNLPLTEILSWPNLDKA